MQNAQESARVAELLLRVEHTNAENCEPLDYHKFEAEEGVVIETIIYRTRSGVWPDNNQDREMVTLREQLFEDGSPRFGGIAHTQFVKRED